jgi:RNA polymerase sigma-70 factor, ECF subfamily
MRNWHEVDDVQLLKSAKDGEADAFGELYARYARVVYRFIFARIDDPLDAEDLTEDVFLKVWRSLSNYREQGFPFLAFLFRIARNSISDHYRSAQRISRRVSDTVNNDQTAIPDDILTAGFEHQEICHILDQLREDYRMVLILRFLSEFSPEETAQIMGRSSGAVRVLQHRALAAARNVMQ